jgi:beta-phosphoglucomutase-like phosphatase (HAD superfamily)
MTYIFDFDGTLVDSMPIWAGVHIKALMKAGIKVPENFVEIITPLGNINASKYTISLGLEISLDDYLKNISELLYYEYLNNVKLKECVFDSLKDLKKAGSSLNVLTASPHYYVDGCLKKHNVYDLFDNVWTIDDFVLTKAQPEIYIAVAKKLGVNISECLFFDDNLTALKTAKAAGMKTVGVYDLSSKNNTEQIKGISDYYIESYNCLHSVRESAKEE